MRQLGAGGPIVAYAPPTSTAVPPTGSVDLIFSITPPDCGGPAPSASTLDVYGSGFGRYQALTFTATGSIEVLPNQLQIAYPNGVVAPFPIGYLTLGGGTVTVTVTDYLTGRVLIAEEFAVRAEALVVC